MNPWADGDEPASPRRPGWGCLAAAIVVAIGTVVIAIMAANLLGTVFSGVRVR
jgi:hypothetical protein